MLYPCVYVCVYIYGGFHKCAPIAGWSIVENPMKMDDLQVPLFQETSMYKVDRWMDG
jgi:hypothetical protein